MVVGKTRRFLLPSFRVIAICGFIIGNVPARAEQVNPQPQASQPTADQSLWQRSRLTGDWGGARSWLETGGVSSSTSS